MIIFFYIGMGGEKIVKSIKFYRSSDTGFDRIDV